MLATVAGLEANTLADGFFHGTAYLYSPSQLALVRRQDAMLRLVSGA
jgi:hypothetical protein